MESKFDKTIRLFFEGIKTPKNPYTEEIKVSYSRKAVLSFYRKVLEDDGRISDDILSDRYVNIVVEAASEVNFNQPVLDLILDARFGQQIMPQEILNKLNKNWIYYEDCKERLKMPLYVFKFDFTREPKKSVKALAWLYGGEAYRDAEEIEEIFKKASSGKPGFVKIEEDGKFASMFLDSANANKKTVAHELCHYLQAAVGILRTKETFNAPSCGIQELQLTEKDLEYLLNEKEFLAHVYVDMFYDFKKFWKKAFPELSKEQFLELLFKRIEEKQNLIMFTEDIGFKWMATMKDSTSLMMLAALKYLDFKFEETKKKLEEDF